MKKKFSVWLALIAAMALAFAGCADNGAGDTGDSSGSGDSGDSIGSDASGGGGSGDTGDSSGSGDSGEGGGSSTPTVDYEIANGTFVVYTAEGLQAWAEVVNEGGAGVKCTLGASIDMSGVEWTPIDYSGTFDGGGHTVYNLAITADGIAGFFGNLSGTVQDLGLEIASITGEAATAGGIAGFNENGTIDGCWSTGNIAATEFAGGIAGQNMGTITGCWSTASVEAGNCAGGIAGESIGQTIACYYSTGTVAATGNDGFAGGIAGESMGQTVACYSTGTVTATSEYGSAGGIAGHGFGDVCYYSNAEKGMDTGDAENMVTKVDGSEVTWKTAQDAMNEALAALGGDSATDWRYTGAGESADDSDAPTLTK